MSERFRHSSGVGYTFTSTTKMESDFSPKKTMIILVIVVGCFAVLWPKVFYPMLVGSANQHMKPSAIDRTTGCCYVLSEMDVDTIKIMSELCGNIIKEQMGEARLTGKQIINICQDEVLKTCGIDISAVLQEQVRLGQSTKDILDQVRSMNGSLCLKYNFGVAPWRLGVAHIVTIRNASDSVRQERPAHVRSEMVHPAFKERGRAIPQTASPSRPPPKIIDGRPGPIPSMRPTIGGGGHVAAKQGTGSMGVIMPIYTIGIVVFFTYTLMKIIFKKHPDTDTIYSSMERDVRFRKDVPRDNGSRDNGSCKLGWKERDARDVELDQLRRRLRETELAMERVVAQMAKVPLKSQDEHSSATNLSNGSIKKDEKSSVKIMAMETSESCEGGKKWQSVNSSVLPNVPLFVNEHVAPPQEIYLDRALPPQSQILVTDSATETENNSGEDPAVVLAGKMTLSVISLENENLEIDETLNADKNEKIDTEILDNSKHMIEEEINSMIEEAIENLCIEKLDISDIEDTRIEPVEEILDAENKNIDTIVINGGKNEQHTPKSNIISKPSEDNVYTPLHYVNSSEAKNSKNEIIVEVKDNTINKNELLQSIKVHHSENFGSGSPIDLIPIQKNDDNAGLRDISKISDLNTNEDFSLENTQIDANSTESETTLSEAGEEMKIVHTSVLMHPKLPSEVLTEFLEEKSSNEADNKLETSEIQLSTSNTSNETPINVAIESSTEDVKSNTAPTLRPSDDKCSIEADVELKKDFKQLSNDGSSYEANNVLIAQIRSPNECDEELKTSHIPLLNAKSSSEDSGSTVHSVLRQESEVKVSTDDAETEEEDYVLEEKADDESEEEIEVSEDEEIEVSEDEDIEENEMNRESSDLSGRLNANDAIFINGAKMNHEDDESGEGEETEESDEEEVVEEIIEEYSDEEEEEDSGGETNDVGHLSSNGNRD